MNNIQIYRVSSIGWRRKHVKSQRELCGATGSRDKFIVADVDDGLIRKLDPAIPLKFDAISSITPAIGTAVASAAEIRKSIWRESRRGETSAPINWSMINNNFFDKSNGMEW